MSKSSRSTSSSFFHKLVRLAAVGALTLLCLPLSVRPAAAQTSEEIRSFASEIDVQADGSISVTERIEYYFPEARHGIYRDIPVSYVDDQNKRYGIPIAVGGVSDEFGSPVANEVTRGSSGLRIRIGDPNVTVTGLRTYVIRYSASGALRYFQDHDELYWNATGTAWTVPIARSSARVRLPDSVPADSLTVKCYTGAAGSVAEDCMKNIQGHVADFAANGNLTVVVGWQPGIIAKQLPEYPSPLFGYLIYLLPLLVFCGMWWLWTKRGRDPAGRGTIVVQYEPPAALSPAECGALLNEGSNTGDVTATIIDLAVHGFLKIREVTTKGVFFDGTDHELVKLQPTKPPELKPYEAKLMATLFRDGDAVTVSGLKGRYAFQDSLPYIKQQIEAVMLSGGYEEKNPRAVRMFYIGLAILVGFLGFWLLIPFAVAVGVSGTSAVVSLGISVLSVLGFGWLMPRRTAAGVAAYEHLLGFKDFLKTAEKYRLQWQEKENIFEQYLPFAMVLGVVDKWATAFDGMMIKQPTWYEGRAFASGAFRAAAFNSAFASLNSTVSSAVLSRPQQTSSGSGFSGGHSGGGHGGGGGGSW